MPLQAQLREFHIFFSSITLSLTSPEGFLQQVLASFFNKSSPIPLRHPKGLILGIQ